MVDFSTYFPFTGGPEAAEADWGLFAPLWATTGVVREADSELVVTAAGHTLSVNVLAGQVWVQGFFGRMGVTTNLTVTTAAVSLPRIDLIVARANFASHKMELLCIAGTPAASPTVPALTRIVGVTWDIALAQIAVGASASGISTAEITDRRPFTSAGGVVRVPTQPSALTLYIPNAHQVPQGWITMIPVSGTTNIASITPGTYAGQIVILEFLGALAVTAGGGSYEIDYPMGTRAGSLLTLQWDGTVWRELARAGEVAVANTIKAGPTSGAVATPTYRALVAADFPSTLWSTLSPTTFGQLNGVSFTTGYARYFRLGTAFIYAAQITTTSVDGPSGQYFRMTLPFNITAPAGVAIGTFVYDPASGNPYSGVVVVYTAPNLVAFNVPDRTANLGADPVTNVAIGDILTLTIMGELA